MCNTYSTASYTSIMPYEDILAYFKAANLIPIYSYFTKSMNDYFQFIFPMPFMSDTIEYFVSNMKLFSTQTLLASSSCTFA